MLVLDYIKYLKGNSIEIPPFHTGHLGFIPGTKVNLGLMTPFSSDASHCEIVVSPFELTKELAIIRCKMKDGIGVVKKLIDALSYLKINIETEESSSINHLNHHSINLIVNISSSKMPSAPTRESVQRMYHQYRHVCPIYDYKYLKIFEAIMAFCGDSIEYEDVSGKKRLSLYVHPLEKRNFKFQEPSVIKSGQKLSAIIDLPPPLIKNIRLITEIESNKDIPYLILSDTKERNLRIFFPKNNTVPKLIHIGVYHSDRPGALSTILELFANSDFNILTSLLRKQTTSISIWEAILEFRGKNSFPKFSNGEQKHRWVAKTLIKRYKWNFGIRNYDLKIGEPLYPKGDKKELVRLNSILNTTKKIKGKRKFDIGDQVKNTIERLSAKENVKNYELNELFNTLKKRVGILSRPSIFLSYPHTADKHAKLIKSHLKNKYAVIDYYDADGKIIHEQVIDRIKGCDYFIAVWHFDESLPLNNGKYNVSPWMPLELGIALSENKKILMIRSEKLPDEVWKRITPHIAIQSYSDIYFQSETLKAIGRYCEEHFV